MFRRGPVVVRHGQGLMGVAVRTVVVARTATAVSRAVAKNSIGRGSRPAQQVDAPTASELPPAPPPVGDDRAQ